MRKRRAEDRWKNGKGNIGGRGLGGTEDWEGRKGREKSIV